jgi:DNA primase
VIGFSGRIFGETDDQGGKYINSPETLVYQKGRVLYGFDRAKAEIRRAGVAILVEGQLDLILSHQAEAKNAVAVSGTALTTDHLTALRRLAETLVIAFDGDEAGVAAAKRAISMGLAAGFTVKLARLPGGIDPADLILQDKTEWTKAVEQSELVIDFLLHKAEEDSKDKLSLIHQIEAEVYPYLAALPNAHDRDHYINQIARLTQLPENSIREKLAAIKVAPVTDNKNSAPALSRRQRIIEELFGLAYLNANLGEELKKVLGDVEYHHQSTTLAPRQSELTLAAELGYAGMEASRLEGETKRLLNNLQLEIWQEEIEKLRFALGEAERRGGEQEGRELLAQLQSLYQRVNHLKNEEK